MSIKQAETYCEAVEGQFAWFQQLCMKTAITTVEVDGDHFGACAAHDTTPIDKEPTMTTQPTTTDHDNKTTAKSAAQIGHPSEVEYSAENHRDAISITADDACPDWVLIGISEDHEHKAGIYLTAYQATQLAAALNHFAAEVTA